MITHANTFVPAAPRTGFGRFVKAAKAYRAQLRTEQALNVLDDHLMRDIGLPPRESDAQYNLLRLARGPW